MGLRAGGAKRGGGGGAPDPPTAEPIATPSAPTSPPTVPPAPTATPAPTVQPTPTVVVKQALLIIFDQFEQLEYSEPRAALEKQGIQVRVASSSTASVVGSTGQRVQPDVALSAVQTADYDAIVFIGGYNYDDTNADAIRIAQEAVAQDKIVAAICVAPITLVKAGVLKDKRATSSMPFATLKAAGAIYTSESVARDGRLITGNGPAASRNFGQAIAAALAEPPATPVAGTIGEMAFASDLDGDFEIWLINADGRNPRQLTDNAFMDSSPAWSPDGRQIAFVSNRDGNDEIYRMNADGSDVRRLTDTPDASESFPAWSPDGQRISFDSDRGGNWDVYVMDSAGSNLQRLTDHPGEDWISSWSPDATQIAFESKRDGNYELYVVEADGKTPQRLTQNTVQDGAPKWSPTGAQIAFFSRRDGDAEIYVMDSDGSHPKRLTNHARDDSFPAWSPDGTQIVFTSSRTGHDEIYVMDADGRAVRQVTDNGAQNWSPAWRPGPLVPPTAPSDAFGSGRCHTQQPDQSR